MPYLNKSVVCMLVVANLCAVVYCKGFSAGLIFVGGFLLGLDYSRYLPN